MNVIPSECCDSLLGTCRKIEQWRIVVIVEILIKSFFALMMLGMLYAGWKQIPPESPEIIEARQRYGKAK